MKYCLLVVLVLFICGCSSTAAKRTWPDEIAAAFDEAHKVYPNAIIHKVYVADTGKSYPLVTFEFYAPKHDIVSIIYNLHELGSVYVEKATSSKDISEFSKDPKQNNDQVLKNTVVDYNRAKEIGREKGVQFAHKNGGTPYLSASLWFPPEIESYFSSSSSAWLLIYTVNPISTPILSQKSSQTSFPTMYVWVDGKTGQILWESDRNGFPPK